MSKFYILESGKCYDKIKQDKGDGAKNPLIDTIALYIFAASAQVGVNM